MSTQRVDDIDSATLIQPPSGRASRWASVIVFAVLFGLVPFGATRSLEAGGDRSRDTSSLAEASTTTERSTLPATISNMLTGAFSP